MAPLLAHLSRRVFLAAFALALLTAGAPSASAQKPLFADAPSNAVAADQIANNRTVIRSRTVTVDFSRLGTADARADAGDTIVLNLFDDVTFAAVRVATLSFVPRMGVNFLKSTSKLAAGQQLVVPQQATALMAAQTQRTAPTESASNSNFVADVVVAAVDTRPSPTRSERKVIYQVKKGDTPSSIARVFSTSVASIKNWNQIPGTVIRVGERLTIYSSGR